MIGYFLCIGCGDFDYRKKPKKVKRKEGKMLYKRVKELADANGIPIYKLEKEAGLGNGVIAGWKECSPRVDNLKRVADVLHVTINELMKEEA